MKSFLSLFSDSFKSLKDLRTITTTAMLLAVGVAIRSLSIQITADIRITFGFLAICIVAVLYGPVVSGMSNLALDLIGFLIDNKSARGYSLELMLVVIFVGVLYGIFLYKQEFSKSSMAKGIFKIILARGSVVLLGNIILNSYFIYSLYVNKDFNIISFFSDEDIRSGFLIWWGARVGKNLIQLPVDIIILAVIIPSATIAYKNVRRIYSRA